jgi:hypothetical protein
MPRNKYIVKETYLVRVMGGGTELYLCENGEYVLNDLLGTGGGGFIKTMKVIDRPEAIKLINKGI